MIHIKTPLQDVAALRAGDQVLISGIIYTARDAAHQRLVELVAQGQSLPFPPEGAVIYYVGPTPAKPGQVIGSAGPTTSARLDGLTIPLLERGVKGMIGKGGRSPEVVAAMQKYGAVYFAAIGGAAALIAKSIKKAEVVAYPDLGTEAIRRLVVEEFPAIVAIDCAGANVFQTGVAQYRRLNFKEAEQK